MIIRPAGDALHFITQPDHAALSRRVMEAWRSLEHHPRRHLILTAIERHDNGWREADASPRIEPETGAPADFVRVALDVRQGVWPRGVARAAEAHPWVGALVAHHAVTVYHRYRSDPAWTQFFFEMEAARGRLVERSRLPEHELAGDYGFLRLGDLASLTFCACWTEEQLHDDTRMRLEGDRLLVSPDPFGGDKVSIAVDAREMRAQSYASDDALRERYLSAPLVRLTGVAMGTVPTVC